MLFPSETMAGERVTLSQVSGISSPPFEVHVLVVDDDATTLKITLGMLSSLNYKAEGIKHPLLALERLRKKQSYFDLIVIDVHMPDIDGFKLKQRVDEEFPIPVIMISVDNNERVMEKALMSGVVRYIVKPATPNDFKGIWQFVVTATMKGKKTVATTTGSGDSTEDSWGDPNSSAFRKEKGMLKRKDYEARALMNTPLEDNASNLPKKTKVIWTNDLQTRFLEAINIIGLQNAVPKRILEVMNTPGLTRENVASHLQKYRLFLKRVARMFTIVMNDVTDKDVLLSSLASKYPSLMLKNIGEEFERIIRQTKLRTPNLSSNRNSTISQFGYERSKLWSNPHLKPHHSFCSKMNPIFQMDFSGTETSNLSNVINRSSPAYPPYQYKHGLSQMPSSNYTNYNARIGLTTFDKRIEMSQIQPMGNRVSNAFDYGHGWMNYQTNLNSNSSWGEVSLASEVYSANLNQSLAKSMGGNNMENILVQPIYEQQQQRQQQYQISNEECYQTFAIGDNTNDASHLSGIDYNINSVVEGIYNEFSNQQHENEGEISNADTNPTDCTVEIITVNRDASKQQEEEVAGEDIHASVHSSDDYFLSFDQVQDQLLGNLNVMEFDQESIKELEQIPQDWQDDFLESLFNNGA